MTNSLRNATLIIMLHIRRFTTGRLYCLENFRSFDDREEMLLGFYTATIIIIYNN